MALGSLGVALRLWMAKSELANLTTVGREADVEALESSCNMEGAGGSGMTDKMAWTNAIWILISSFIIFMMQSGFGLLESGACGKKNKVNIMMKNAVDVIFGGLSFWMFGFGIAFDDATKNKEEKNPFSGTGPFFVDFNQEQVGYIFSHFIFQLSLSTTASTIVSGAMAERTKLGCYIVFSFLNTVLYCFPAYWISASGGFLKRLGVVDVGGAGPVHLVSAAAGLVATIMLKPRHGRFQKEKAPNMGCPTNVLLGMFMLWWGWLGLNCASTFRISSGKWKLAARSAATTMIASMAGGGVALTSSFILKKRIFDIRDLVSGILGSLVSITAAACALAHPWEALVVGAIGSLLSLGTSPVLARLRIDDPVSVVGVHGAASVWGMLSVGLYVEKDSIGCLTQGRSGLSRGGGCYLLGVQAVSCIVMAAWALIVAYILLKLIDLAVGLGVSLKHELLGADLVEHGINGGMPTSPPSRPDSYDKDSNQPGVAILADNTNGNFSWFTGRVELLRHLGSEVDMKNKNYGAGIAEQAVHGVRCCPDTVPADCIVTVSCAEKKQRVRI